MQLQRQVSRRYKGREYSKWVITVPPRQIKELGWAEGEFLKSDVMRQELIIRKENSRSVEKRREVAKRTSEARRRTRK